MKARTIILLCVASATLAAGCVPEKLSAPVSPGPVAPAQHVGTGTEISDLLARIRIVEKLPDLAGYDRDCGRRDGCVFGPAWTDDYIGPGSHDGCDTRNQLLAYAMRDVMFKPGTHNCKVLEGTLDEPYTGRTVRFTSREPKAVAVDHMFPLSRAWDAGAASWTLEQRKSFANDLQDNFFAVDGRENQRKSDSGPDHWMPDNVAFRCEYTRRYLTVAAKYDLLVTVGDVRVAQSACQEHAR
ncbi:HNH endonuclease family protein [Antrihabitans spumae]|uniref:HNH endonuclease family protein n=1 Tax=Antrihabitans spumae TaxID=3373370 RepID=A0ABW7KCL5_9NOCA